MTDSALSCNRDRGPIHKLLVIPRTEVKEIRVEEPGGDRTIAGALVGGAAGAIFGGLVAARSSDPETRVYSPIFFVLTGGALGAGFGRGLHRHGPVVYRRQ